LKSGALRVRQRPGTKNALGAVKFVLPNTMDIYLHSTPAQQLFRETRRDFSHGCIRLSDPPALAEFVLRDQPAWTPERIRDAMAAGKLSTATLTRPIPVVLFYTTAIVDAKGRALFTSDIYGFDRKLEEALRTR
jgi:murein L,D-transpeptidase YcbB/YkuD